MADAARASGLPVLFSVQGVMRDCAAHLCDGVPEKYRRSGALWHAIDKIIPGELLDNMQASFDALAAGGRIPPAAAQLTAKLDVKPELSYDLAGSLSLIGVNRGRKKALKSILKSFRENYVPDRTMPIAIMTADAEKDGDWLEAAIRKEEGCADVTIIRSSVGPTIGSHVGPGMVACAFWGKNRASRQALRP